MEIARYIMNIFRSNLTVIFSWGFCNPIVLENGLSFNVNGFKHKGKVAVIYNEGIDLFDIHILDFNDNIIEKIEGIYVDQLIEVIDNRIERVDNYTKAVLIRYGLKDM